MSKNLNFEESLLKSIIDIIIFIEFSKLDNDDIAIQLLEQIAFDFQQLEKNDKIKLKKLINNMQQSYVGEKYHFVGNLPEMLGIEVD